MVYKSHFVLCAECVNFTSDGRDVKVLMYFSICEKPGSARETPEYFIHQPLYDINVGVASASPQLKAVCPNGLYYSFVNQQLVLKAKF